MGNKQWAMGDGQWAIGNSIPIAYCLLPTAYLNG